MGAQVEKKNKEPLSDKKIHKIILILTFSVAGLYFLKDLIGKNWMEAAIIGAVLAIFAIIVFGMRLGHVKDDTKQLVVSVALVCVIGIVSINSGESYSDDYPLFLAAIGLSGMYLKPLYPRVQMVAADIMMIVQFICAPQKAGGASQFILCAVTFNLAAVMIYLIVNRGHAFIIKSQLRAEEVEEVIESLSVINKELNHNFEATGSRMIEIQNVNQQVKDRTTELLTDSQDIADGVVSTIETCSQAREKVQNTRTQLEELRTEVKHFEEVLLANDKNIDDMEVGITSVKDSAAETAETFSAIQQQMEQIVAVMGQLQSIASSTTMLALNASIEAARAGQAGAGFAVVATNVQELAVDSNKCASEVEHVVTDMQRQVDRTLEQMQESTRNVDNSKESLEALNHSFRMLTEKFTILYQNIEEQNSSVIEVEAGFDDIQDEVIHMQNSTTKNQSSIAAIADSLKIYGENMQQMKQDTEKLKNLAESMEAEITNR